MYFCVTKMTVNRLSIRTVHMSIWTTDRAGCILTACVRCNMGEVKLFLMCAFTPLSGPDVVKT